LLHYLFSNIKTIDDVPSAVERLFIEGVISTDEERVKLSSFVTEKLQTDIAKEWFRPGLTLYNECSILFRDENGELQSRRPDRVIKEGRKMTVIDFKFGKPSPKYQKQIDEYVDLLTKMGYEAQGHIWYVGVPDEI
jgi:predicted RecB family nuclease